MIIVGFNGSVYGRHGKVSVYSKRMDSGYVYQHNWVPSFRNVSRNPNKAAHNRRINPDMRGGWNLLKEADRMEWLAKRPENMADGQVRCFNPTRGLLMAANDKNHAVRTACYRYGVNRVSTSGIDMASVDTRIIEGITSLAIRMCPRMTDTEVYVRLLDMDLDGRHPAGPPVESLIEAIGEEEADRLFRQYLPESISELIVDSLEYLDNPGQIIIQEHQVADHWATEEEKQRFFQRVAHVGWLSEWAAEELNKVETASVES